MTVKRLRESLKQYPDDMQVVVSGYESGWDDIKSNSLSIRTVFLNYGTKSYEGQHEDKDCFADKRAEKLKTAKVLAISRSSN